MPEPGGRIATVHVWRLPRDAAGLREFVSAGAGGMIARYRHTRFGRVA